MTTPRESPKHAGIESPKDALTAVPGDPFGFQAACVTFSAIPNFPILTESTSYHHCTGVLLTDVPGNGMTFPNIDYVEITVPTLRFSGGRVEPENLGCSGPTFPGMTITQGATVVSVGELQHKDPTETPVGDGWHYIDGGLDSIWTTNGNLYRFAWTPGNLPFTAEPPPIVITLPGTTDWPRQELQSVLTTNPDRTTGVVTQFTSAFIDRHLTVGDIDLRDEALYVYTIDVDDLDPPDEDPAIAMPFPLGVDGRSVTITDDDSPQKDKTGVHTGGTLYASDYVGRNWYHLRDAEGPAACGRFLYTFDVNFKNDLDSFERGRTRTDPQEVGVFAYNWLVAPYPGVGTDLPDVAPFSVKVAPGTTALPGTADQVPTMSIPFATFHNVPYDSGTTEIDFEIIWSGPNVTHPTSQTLLQNHYELSNTLGPFDDLPSWATIVFKETFGTPPGLDERWTIQMTPTLSDFNQCEDWRFYIGMVDTQTPPRDARSILNVRLVP